MTASREGTASLVLQWLTFLVLAVLCLRELATVPALLLGSLAFKLARDAMTYSSVVDLAGAGDETVAPRG